MPPPTPRVALLATLLAAAASTANPPANPPVVLEPSETALTLRNGFLSATFDLLCPRLSALRGGARGDGSYGANVLVPRTGVRLELQPFDALGCMAEERGLGSAAGQTPALPCPYANPPARTSAQHGCRSQALGYRVATNTTSEVSVVIAGVVDSVDSPGASSTWTLTLRRGARGIELRVEAVTIAAANVTAVRLSSDFTPRSLYAGYDKGVLQMMDSPHPFYGAPAGNPLRRFYALGGVGDRGGAVEVLPLPAAGGAAADAVLIARGSWRSGQSGATGLQLVMRGSFSTAEDSCAFRPGLGPKAPGSPVEWTRGWENVAPTRIERGEKWTAAVCLLANDYAYPPSRGGDAASSCAIQSERGAAAAAAALGENAHDGTDDEGSVLSALYGSAMGVQTTFINHPLGAVVGGLASPIQFAEGSYSNFDPDSWVIVNSMTMARYNDSFVLSEARKLLDTTIAGMCSETILEGEGRCVAGQMPLAMYPKGGFCDREHSCAKSKALKTDLGTVFFPSYCPHQLCPTAANVFVPLAMMDFADKTGDYAWLESNLPQLRAAAWMHTAFNLVNFSAPSDFDKVGLVRCPGPLWVDGFKRSNFTAETNMFAFEVFRRLALVEAHFGNSSGAAKAGAVAATLKASINAKLWDYSSADHYVTQLNPDGSVADFMDIDGNLIAVALGIADDLQAKAIMQRLKALPCIRPGGYGTLLTGKYMGGSASTGSACDASVTMARVFYVDALSLRRVGDAATFSHMLSTMQADQTRNTWMAERYTCDGLSSHDPFYHEYPEVIAMVIERVKYGINIGLSTIEVLPWTALFSPGAPGEAKARPRAQTGKAHAGPMRASFQYTLSGTVIEYAYRCVAGGGGEEGCSLSVQIQLPRLSGTKRFRVGGFETAQAVQVRATAAAANDAGSDADGEERSMRSSADGDGVVEFDAPAGAGWKLSIAAVSQ